MLEPLGDLGAMPPGLSNLKQDPHLLGLGLPEEQLFLGGGTGGEH